MEPLAPTVDQMRELAVEEIPAPRTCEVQLWDDGTFDVVVYHGIIDGGREQLRYQQTTSEIVWERYGDARLESETISGGETVYEPVVDDLDVRVLTTVEPPYK